MPSESVLKVKQALVVDLANKLKAASSGVLVDYKGITVEKDTKLRTDLRNANVDYTVVKNTLTRFAADVAGLSGLDDVLEGTTALAVHMSDEILPAKILFEYAKKNDNFKIKAGFLDGKVITAAEVERLAKLPSKEILIATVLGTLNAPITGLVNVLNGNLRGLVFVLSAISEQKANA